MSLKQISSKGDTLEQLKELRGILAKAIDNCESNRDLSSLTRRYIGVIEAIDRRESGTDDNDEIATIILRNRKSDTN